MENIERPIEYEPEEAIVAEECLGQIKYDDVDRGL